MLCHWNLSLLVSFFYIDLLIKIWFCVFFFTDVFYGMSTSALKELSLLQYLHHTYTASRGSNRNSLRYYPYFIVPISVVSVATADIISSNKQNRAHSNYPQSKSGNSNSNRSSSSNGTSKNNDNTSENLSIDINDTGNTNNGNLQKEESGSIHNAVLRLIKTGNINVVIFITKTKNKTEIK